MIEPFPGINSREELINTKHSWSASVQIFRATVGPGISVKVREVRLLWGVLELGAARDKTISSAITAYCKQSLSLTMYQVASTYLIILPLSRKGHRFWVWAAVSPTRGIITLMLGILSRGVFIQIFSSAMLKRLSHVSYKAPDCR